MPQDTPRLDDTDPAFAEKKARWVWLYQQIATMFKEIIQVEIELAEYGFEPKTKDVQEVIKNMNKIKKVEIRNTKAGNVNLPILFEELQ